MILSDVGAGEWDGGRGGGAHTVTTTTSKLVRPNPRIHLNVWKRLAVLLFIILIVTRTRPKRSDAFSIVIVIQSPCSIQLVLFPRCRLRP